MPLPLPQTTATMELTSLLNRGTSLLANPVAAPAALLRGQLGPLQSQLTSQLGLMSPSHVGFPTLRNFSNVLSGSQTQVAALVAHTGTMIFGDSAGSLISGGLQANLGMARSALSLNNAIAAIGEVPPGTTSPSDPCAIFGDFFKSVLGAGAALISQISTLVNQAMEKVNEMINKINQMVNAAVSAIQAAISSVMAQINAFTAQIQAAINDVTKMISDELSNFAKWINLHLNFNLSSFLSGIVTNPCAKMLLDAVVSPIGMSVLSQVLPGNLRPTRPILPRMF